MKRIISISLVIFNLVFSILFLLSFDNREYSIYASQTGANSIENADAKEPSFFTFFQEIIKDNATESPIVGDNATESLGIKANVTESPIVNANNPSSSEATSAKNLKFCYNSQFGSLGTGDGQFNRPHDIVFDSKWFIYVNDRELTSFQKFSPDGKFISKFGEKGEKLGQYSSPYSMGIDSNDHIYVLDRGNDRIQKVSIDGTPLGALYSYDGVFITSNDDISKADNKDKKPSPEEKFKQFASPEAMTIDKEGNFYLTDTGHNRIIKFDKDFKYLSHFGQAGS